MSGKEAVRLLQKGPGENGRPAFSVRVHIRVPLLPHVRKRVLPSSVVYTDELKSYDGLKRSGYQHRRIHHAEQVYVSGTVHTNTIEGFWSLMKRGINGVYHAVSAKHLHGYLNEYVYRYNHRGKNQEQFKKLLLRAALSL